MMEVRETEGVARAESQNISVSVLLFSILRERIGHSQIQIRVRPNARVRDLLDAVCAEYPQVREFRDAIRVGLNAEYARADAIVRDGDEVALITPVSGG